MEKTKLLSKISETLNGFTILNTGISYKFGVGLSEKERKKRTPHGFAPDPYDIQKDVRIHDILSSSPDYIEYVVETILMGIWMENSRDMTEAEVQKLLHEAGTTAKEMNHYTKYMKENLLPEIVNRPDLIILAKALEDTVYQRNQDVQIRLQNALAYLRKNKIISFRTREGSETVPYENFIMRFVPEVCKQRALAWEMEHLLKFVRQEKAYLDDATQQEISENTKQFYNRNILNVAPMVSKEPVPADKSFQNVQDYIQELRTTQESKIKKLAQYSNQIQAYAIQSLNEINRICVEEKMDASLISESALYAIAYGDVLYRLPMIQIAMQKYLGDHLGIRLMSPTTSTSLIEQCLRETEGSIPVIEMNDSFQYEDMKPDIPKECFGKEFGHVISLIASLSGSSVFKGLNIWQTDIDIFKAVGMTEEKARECAIITEMLREEDDVPPYIFKVPPAEDEKAVMRKTLHTVQSENHALQRSKTALEKENKALRHDLENLRRENKKIRERLSGMKNTEMASIVSEEVENSGTEGIHFPYYTDKKVVVYGGFDSFLQELKKMIPNIRVIPLVIHPDWSPLRNADIVFLQPNKMKHSNYYAALNAIKKTNTPYIHLKNASPKVCAEQIVTKLEKMDHK